MSSALHKSYSFLRRELGGLLPPFIFFLIVFHVVAMARQLIDRQYDIEIGTSVGATLGALIVGKAILISDKLPLMKWFANTRLVYNMAWKMLIYVFFILVFQFAEELISILPQHDNILIASRKILDEINWNKFWAIHILLVLFLLAYCMATTIISVFGHKRIVDAFMNSKVSTDIENQGY